MQFETPRRVRYVSPDKQWVAVEGSNTGIPMTETLVQNATEETPAPPVIPPEPIATPASSSTEKNYIKVVLDGDKLQISAANIDATGLERLAKQISKYKEILELEEDDRDGEGE